MHACVYGWIYIYIGLEMDLREMYVCIYTYILGDGRYIYRERETQRHIHMLCIYIYAYLYIYSIWRWNEMNIYTLYIYMCWGPSENLEYDTGKSKFQGENHLVELICWVDIGAAGRSPSRRIHQDTKIY